MEKTELVKQILEYHGGIDRTMRKMAFDKTWMGLTISVAQLKSLFFIANEGVTNSRKLAAALGVTPANVTGIVDRLVEQGLISRSENTEDRRMLLLQPTDKGQKLIADLREKEIMRLSGILEKMSPEELSVLSQGLSALYQACRRNNIRP